MFPANIYLCILVTLTAVQYAYQEHFVSAGFNFNYYPELNGMFVGSNQIVCYLAFLNHAEQDAVMTIAGSAKLEEEMLRDWIGVLPETMIFHNDYALPLAIKRLCSQQEILLLNRPQYHHSNDSTTQSIVAPTKPVSHSAVIHSSATSGPTKAPSLVPHGDGSTHPSSHLPHGGAATTKYPTVANGGGSTTSGPVLPVVRTTISLLPVTATSSWTRRTTPTLPSLGYIIYDGNSHNKIVIVDKGVCYVYELSDLDNQLLIGDPTSRQRFELQLLSKSRDVSTMWEITGHIQSMSSDIQAACTGKVYLFP